MSSRENPTHPCQVCSHPDRAAIETAMISGKGQRAIARDFGIGSNVGTPNFLADHKKVARHIAHMGEAYREARAARERDHGMALVERMAELDEAVNEALARAREGVILTDADGVPLLNPDGSHKRRYDDRILLAAVREARANVDLEARLAGAIPDADPEAAEVARAALLSPEARRLVADLEQTLAEHADSSGER